MPRQFTASQPPTRVLRLRAPTGFVSPSWLNGKEVSRNGIKDKSATLVSRNGIKDKSATLV